MELMFQVQFSLSTNQRTDKSVAIDAGVTNYIDDEYQLAGVDDPRILITTSRNPSARLKQFAKVCYKYVFLSGKQTCFTL